MSAAVAVGQVAEYEASEEDSEHKERLDEARLVAVVTHQVPLSTRETG